MGPGKRSLIGAAVTVVCAVTVLGAPGTAFASPGPGPSASATHPASASPAPTPSPSGTAMPSPSGTAVPDKDLEAVREKLDGLYHDAAVATDAYNAAEEKAERQSDRLAALSRRIADGQRRLEELEDRAGAAARAQYRGGGLPPEARLVLSDDPQEFLDGAGRVLQGERAVRDLLTEMARTQRQLEDDAADASARWKKLEADRRAKAAAKKRVERRIAAAKKLESSLEKRQRQRLARLEQQAAARAQAAWLATGVLENVKAKASAQGRKAVEFATAQIGKPYVWGAEGPKSYDCSGLTSQAWAAAGRPVPRTSQEQWKRLRHVEVTDMRPGDLVVYYDDASHVALYVGDGMIVHAPRPGRTVTLAGAGTMPILGVVRPDA
jgi:cell wall-associated NlpC family hydrolase